MEHQNLNTFKQSIELPSYVDNSLSVQLARTLDVARIAREIPPDARSGGLPTAAATIPALAAALESLDTAVAWTHEADPLGWAVGANHHDHPGPAR